MPVGAGALGTVQGLPSPRSAEPQSLPGNEARSDDAPSAVFCLRHEVCVDPSVIPGCVDRGIPTAHGRSHHHRELLTRRWPENVCSRDCTGTDTFTVAIPDRAGG